MEVQFENRTYYFKVVSKTEKEIRIEMYNTLYVLVNTAGKWENHINSRFSLTPALVTAVVSVVTKRD